MTETSVLAIITTVLAGLAHLVERHLAKVEVASSSLVARSRVNQDIRFGCPDFFVRRKELDTDTHARSAIGSEVRQGSCELRSAIRGMPGSEFEPRSPLQKRNTTHWVVFPFLERASLLRKLILRGGLKSRGNRRCAASGGRSEPVSRKRRCLWFSKGHKQQCRDGVHPAKVSPANIPVLADNRKYSIFGLPLIEVRTRCLHLNT